MLLLWLGVGMKASMNCCYYTTNPRGLDKEAREILINNILLDYKGGRYIILL